MKRLIITIVNLENNTVHNLNKSENELDALIDKELGGHDNIAVTSTIFNENNIDEYQQVSRTKDNKYMISILCHTIKMSL